MDYNCLVPLPINFNCWKHHAGFLKKQIESVKVIKDINQLKVYLLKIGESQMDLYFGEYSPAKISEQVLDCLYQKKTLSFNQYQVWLTKDEKDYQLVELKDKSIWTLRLGDDVSRYVHIHPGRYSPNTIRVKATTLKTVILVLCSEKIGKIKSIETQTINQIRKRYLNEPPVKSFSAVSGIGKLIDLLHKKQGVKIVR